MKSIKTQMITVLIVFTIVICSILGVVSYIIFRGAVIDQVNENLLKMAEEAALLVSSRIEVQLTYLETLSENNVVTDVIVDGMSSATSVTMEDKLPYLKKEAERMGFDAIGISDLHGLADRSDGTTEIIGSYDFFAKAAKGNSNVSDVIISKSTKKASIFFAAPAFREGKLVNVVYGVRNAMELSRMIEDISYGTSGYAFIINKDGTLMAHPDFKQVSDMTNYIEIAKEDAGLEELGGILENRITQEEAGVDRYVLDGLEKIMGFAPIPETDWFIAVTADLNDALQDVYDLRNITLLLTALMILLGIAIAYPLSNAFAKPVKYLTGVLERFSNYDLTVYENEGSKYMARKDEIGKAANALVKMQNAISGLIQRVLISSEMAGATSQELSASVQEISINAQKQAANTAEAAASMEEMTANIAVVSDNMQTAAKDTNTITHVMKEVENVIAENTENLEDINRSISEILSALDETRNSINAISVKSRSAAKEADATEKLAVEGRENLNKTVNQMMDIQSTISALSEVINGLGRSAGQIGEITNMIKDVAEQTNLLALNASIEAARAGEHGKGFAVVAQAIGNLADQSQNAAKDIAKVIKNIQTEIEKAVESSEEGTRVVENGTQLVKETSGSLEKMFEAIRAASDVIHEINSEMETQTKNIYRVNKFAGDIGGQVNNLMAAMEEETASTAEIKNSIESINRLINEISEAMEQQSAASEQVSNTVNENAAGIEEISAGSGEIARSAEELAGSVQELVKQVQRFKI
jgi:methyl-accepting chemotaxis protein